MTDEIADTQSLSLNKQLFLFICAEYCVQLCVQVHTGVQGGGTCRRNVKGAWLPSSKDLDYMKKTTNVLYDHYMPSLGLTFPFCSIKSLN